MSCDSVISVRGLSKTYRLYDHPLHGLLARLTGDRFGRYKAFHALDGLSFDVGPGETVGIIGRNGSGKSTLLQLICGIRKPTSGTVTISGRISALLELGSGFHPEFTGRENVFLQGAIAGFSRAEMATRFERIAAFADIGEFIEQPVRMYSSGMFVRLAFAVTVEVEPDILVVDEALAVGDAAFQARCFRRIREIRDKGCAILFVTHSAEQVLRLCSRAILLENGKLLIDDVARTAIEAYRMMTFSPRTSIHSPPEEQTCINSPHIRNPDCLEFGNRKAEIVRACLLDDQQRESLTLQSNSPFTISYAVRFHEVVTSPVFGFTIRDVQSMEVAGTNSFFHGIETGDYARGDTVNISFNQKIPLRAGHYFLSLNCTGSEDNQMVAYHRAHDVFELEIIADRTTLGLIDPDSTIRISSA
jgi:teichoic acid transport system ATP-binding protein